MRSKSRRAGRSGSRGCAARLARAHAQAPSARSPLRTSFYALRANQHERTRRGDCTRADAERERCVRVGFARGGRAVRGEPPPPRTQRARAATVARPRRRPRAFAAVLGREVGGFDFGLKHRNTALVAAAGARVPRAKKTGTTICGLVYKVRRSSSAASRAPAAAAAALRATPLPPLRPHAGRHRAGRRHARDRGHDGMEEAPRTPPSVRALGSAAPRPTPAAAPLPTLRSPLCRSRTRTARRSTTLRRTFTAAARAQRRTRKRLRSSFPASWRCCGWPRARARASSRR